MAEGRKESGLGLLWLGCDRQKGWLVGWWAGGLVGLVGVPLLSMDLTVGGLECGLATKVGQSGWGQALVREQEQAQDKVVCWYLYCPVCTVPKGRSRSMPANNDRRRSLCNMYQDISIHAKVLPYQQTPVRTIAKHRST